MTGKDKIEIILKSKLQVHHLEIIDESFKHAGHNPDAQRGGTHLQLFIVSDDFKDKKLIERHKLINEILKKEFQSGLHALSIKAYTPEELKNHL